MIFDFFGITSHTNFLSTLYFIFWRRKRLCFEFLETMVFSGGIGRFRKGNVASTSESSERSMPNGGPQRQPPQPTTETNLVMVDGLGGSETALDDSGWIDYDKQLSSDFTDVSGDFLEDNFMNDLNFSIDNNDPIEGIETPLTTTDSTKPDNTGLFLSKPAGLEKFSSNSSKHVSGHNKDDNSEQKGEDGKDGSAVRHFGIMQRSKPPGSSKLPSGKNVSFNLDGNTDPSDGLTGPQQEDAVQATRSTATPMFAGKEQSFAISNTNEAREGKKNESTSSKPSTVNEPKRSRVGGLNGKRMEQTKQQRRQQQQQKISVDNSNAGIVQEKPPVQNHPGYFIQQAENAGAMMNSTGNHGRMVSSDAKKHHQYKAAMKRPPAGTTLGEGPSPTNVGFERSAVLGGMAATKQATPSAQGDSTLPRQTAPAWNKTPQQRVTPSFHMKDTENGTGKHCCEGMSPANTHQSAEKSSQNRPAVPAVTPGQHRNSSSLQGPRLESRQRNQRVAGTEGVATVTPPNYGRNEKVQEKAMTADTFMTVTETEARGSFAQGTNDTNENQVKGSLSMKNDDRQVKISHQAQKKKQEFASAGQSATTPKKKASTTEKTNHIETMTFDELYSKFLVDMRDLEDNQNMNVQHLLQMETLFTKAYSESLRNQASFLDLLDQLEDASTIADSLMKKLEDF